MQSVVVDIDDLLPRGNDDYYFYDDRCYYYEYFC